jgi:hypothetical protein
MPTRDGDSFPWVADPRTYAGFRIFLDRIYSILGITRSDFDAQMGGITIWNDDKNLRPAFKKSVQNIEWLLLFWTF